MAKTAHQRAAQKRMDDLHERLAVEVIKHALSPEVRNFNMYMNANTVYNIVTARRQQQGQGK